MQFQILKLILWPRSHVHQPRILQFQPGVVNVISGASKTGKSAVIPIIDYCLASEKCAIPVGVIRDQCEWFGVLIQTDEGQKLFARREPGDQQVTNDMFVVEGDVVAIPSRIELKNTTSDNVKRQLDRLAGLPQLELEPGSERPFKARPSFRDLAAFNFQPQNIVANPGVLFFKADTTEHREKLKSIFPYVLGAVTPALLQVRHELELARADLRRKETALLRMRRASSDWLHEAQTWFLKAVQLGLAPPGQVPDSAPSLLDALRAMLKEQLPPPASPAQVDSVLAHLAELRSQERSVAETMMRHRQRLTEIRRLRESGQNYGDALRLQRDRLAISEWLRNRAISGSIEVLELTQHSAQKLDSLCAALQTVEANAETYPMFTDTLSAEFVEQQRSLHVESEALAAIRTRIEALEGESETAKQSSADLRAIDRFLGNLEQALKVYDRSDDHSPLEEEVNALRERTESLAREASEAATQMKIKIALDRLEGLTSRVVPKLDAEWKNAPIRLDIKELTVQVKRKDRSDYLWEVGSGANWLAYHVAMTLALQQYFLQFKRHPAPALLVYDQPSQVYFPKQEDLISSVGAENSDDIKAVRSVFKVLGDATLKAEGKLQVIVLDHAHTDVWGDLDGVSLTAEWRGDEKLVPVHWQTMS